MLTWLEGEHTGSYTVHVVHTAPIFVRHDAFGLMSSFVSITRLK